MATLVRLIIHQFRHVAAETSLTLSDRTNVILGQNGAGKTTLLNLVSHVVRMDFSQIAEVPFDIEWDLELSLGMTLNARVKNQKQEREPTVPPTVVGGEPAPQPTQGASTTTGPSYSMTYDMHLRGPDASTTTVRPILEVHWGDNPSVIFEGKLVQGARPPPPTHMSYALLPQYARRATRAGRQQSASPAPPADTMLSQAFADVVGHRSTFRFDEGLEMYRALTSPTQDGLLPTSGRLVLRITQKDGRAMNLQAEFVPPAVVQSLFSKYFVQSGPSQHFSPVQDLRFARAEIPMLDKACVMMGFAECELFIGLIKRETTPDSFEHVTFGSPKFRVTKNDGTVIQDQLLSYGQRRLLAFIYYLESCPGIAIVDELVNGFHHNWIAGCLELCKDRQVFLTSQNPLLLDNLELDSLERVEKSFITCHARRQPGQLEQAIWENIDKPRAKLFHDSLSVGFQSISELLRTQGLW